MGGGCLLTNDVDNLLRNYDNLDYRLSVYVALGSLVGQCRFLYFVLAGIGRESHLEACLAVEADGQL